MPSGIITDPDKQRAVLDGWAANISMKELAADLDISSETVRVIVKRGYVKRTRGGNNQRKKAAGDPVEVPEYFCGGCERMVYLDPCQVCRALKGKR